VSDQECRWSSLPVFMAIIALLVLLTNIPLLYGYLNQPPDLRFMGIVAGVRDSNIYFMMMAQGDGGSPILENYFRPGEPNTIYHGFFWFFLGKLAYWLGVSDLAAFHASRVLATVAFVPAIYLFVCRFLESMAERLTAVLVICFGAGAGWIMGICYYLRGSFPFVPSDIGTPEGSAFFTLMTFPHLSVTLIMIFLSMMLVWDSLCSGRWLSALLGGLCGLVIGFIHAFNLIVICLALAMYVVAMLLLKRDRLPLRATIVFGCLSAWPLAYYTFVMFAKPGLLPVGAVRSPTPLAYLVGFAPLAAAGAVRLVSLVRARTLPQSDLFLLCWIVACSALLYSYPVLSQEARAVLGLQLPLAVFAVRAVFCDILPALGLDWGEGKEGGRKIGAAVAVFLFVVLTLPSSFFNIVERSSRLGNHLELFSLTCDELEALAHLRGIPRNGVVLSGERIGIYIPRLAHKRAWMGQYNYPSYDRRMAGIREFYSASTPDSKRYRMLRENDIGFVFHGEHERSLGGFRPERADYLKVVFSNESVGTYRVDLGAASSVENTSGAPKG